MTEALDQHLAQLFVARCNPGARSGTIGVMQKRCYRLNTALKKISTLLKPKKEETLQVYRNFYTRIYDDTNGFTALAEATKKEDILNDLRIVFSGIQKELDPAQGK